MNRKLPHFLLWLGLLLAVPRLLTAADAALEAKVDALLTGDGTKYTPATWHAAIDTLGHDAVPILIERFGKPDPNVRFYKKRVMDCLLRLSSDQSRAFLRDYLKTGTEKPFLDAIAREYPLDYERELVPVLIEKIKVPEGKFMPLHPLEEILWRQPQAAGDLIAALEPTKEAMPAIIKFMGILHRMSGMEFKKVPKATVEPAEYRDFWVKWWEANKDKGIYEWNLENLKEADGELNRNALLNFYRLGDRRAIPHFLAALDSPDKVVQYRGAVGLKGLRGDENASGYRQDQFAVEANSLIPELKREFGQAQP
jgi:hypothetical protein